MVRECHNSYVLWTFCVNGLSPVLSYDCAHLGCAGLHVPNMYMQHSNSAHQGGAGTYPFMCGIGMLLLQPNGLHGQVAHKQN